MINKLLLIIVISNNYNMRVYELISYDLKSQEEHLNSTTIYIVRAVEKHCISGNIVFYSIDIYTIHCINFFYILMVVKIIAERRITISNK